MNVISKRAIAFCIGPALFCALSWLLGYDFNERGEAAALTFLLSLLFGIVGATYPFDKDAA